MIEAELPAEERFEELLRKPGLLVERIVSHGHVTPADTPWLQDHDEWVMVMGGSARLMLEERAEQVLEPGDHAFIPGGVRHWVTFTATDEPTVWIAVHIGIADAEG